MQHENSKFVGQPLERVEDAALLTGRGRYVDDLPVTMKVLNGVSGAARFIDEGVTNFNIGTTVVEYKVMDGTGWTAMWAKCEVQIIVLDEGRVIEQGTHDALVEQGGFYASLHHKQQLEQEVEAYQ